MVITTSHTTEALFVWVLLARFVLLLILEKRLPCVVHYAKSVPHIDIPHMSFAPTVFCHVSFGSSTFNPKKSSIFFFENLFKLHRLELPTCQANTCSFHLGFEVPIFDVTYSVRVLYSPACTRKFCRCRRKLREVVRVVVSRSHSRRLVNGNSASSVMSSVLCFIGSIAVVTQVRWLRIMRGVLEKCSIESSCNESRI